MKISELKPGAGIEIIAKMITKQPTRRTYKCFECGLTGMWQTPQEYKEHCPKCEAKPTEDKGKGVWFQHVTSAVIEDDTGRVYLDLWNDDIEKYGVGDKIHVINGFARSNNSGGVNVSKGKYGSLKKEG